MSDGQMTLKACLPGFKLGWQSPALGISKASCCKLLLFLFLFLFLLVARIG